MESDKNYGLGKLDRQRGLCQIIYSYEVVVWEGITCNTWGRDALRSVGFHIKRTQSRSSSTFKSNFLNCLTIHILIFIFISPREPKDTFGYLMYCHRTLSVPCGSDPLQMSCFLGMVIGRWPRCTSFPIFQLQTSCLFLRACRTHFPCFSFHRPVLLNPLSRTQKLLRATMDICTSLNWLICLN